MATPTEVLKGTHPVGQNSKGAPKPFPGSGKGVLYSDGKGRWVFRDGTTKNYNLYEWKDGGPWKQQTSEKPIIPKVQDAVTGGISSVADFLKILVSPGLWVRIGEGVLGLILIAIGFSKLTGIEPPIVKALT